MCVEQIPGDGGVNQQARCERSERLTLPAFSQMVFIGVLFMEGLCRYIDMLACSDATRATE